MLTSRSKHRLAARDVLLFDIIESSEMPTFDRNRRLMDSASFFEVRLEFLFLFDCVERIDSMVIRRVKKS